MINYPVDHKLSFITDVEVSPEVVNTAILLMLESIDAKVVSHVTYYDMATLQHDTERMNEYLEETQNGVYRAGNCRRPTKEELEG